MKVSNIEYDVETIDKKNKYYSIIEKSDLKNNLWHKNKNIVKFDLIDSNEAFANGIRRVFNDELEIGVMFVHPSELDTDDKFILPDNIIERINLIPFCQLQLEENKELSLSLKVSNDSGDIITIYSKDIKINSKQGGKSTENLFNQNFIICTLRPSKYLYINNITIKKREGFVNNVHTLGTHRYECINVDFAKSSLDTNLKDFRIELKDNGNSSYKQIIQLVRNNLFKRITKVKNLIAEYEMPDDTISQTQNLTVLDNSSNDIYIIKNTKIIDLHSILEENSKKNESMNIYEIHIKGEYHTVGNILTKYVYLEDKNIEIINYKLEHILKNKIIVTIKHSEYKKIIDNALTSFLKDLDTWYKSFK